MNKLKTYLFKKRPYEAVYLFIISAINLYFLVGLVNGRANLNNLSFLKYLPSFIYIILLVIIILVMLISISLYIITRIKKVCLSDKVLYIIRYISFFVTFILLINIIDLWILYFIDKYQTTTKPTSASSTIDTMIFFMKQFKNSFLNGILVTVELSFLGTIIGLFIAFLMVILRMLEISNRDNDLKKALKKIGITISKLYITVIRGTPMIVQAFVFYYLVLGLFRPTMTPSEYTSFVTYVWTPFRAGLFTVSINTGAYLTEVLRGGINAIDKGQTEGAKSLGLNKVQTMIHVIFPQAIKNALPSIGNEFIINIKDTSVLAMISVLDLFSVGNQTILGSGGYSGKSLEVYLLLAVYYLLLTLIIGKILKWVELKFNMPVKELTSSN